MGSKIEWTDETWNPVTGCTKVSPGCANCYAERTHKRLRAMGSANYQHPFNEVRCHRSALDKPLRWRERRRVFVGSMSDIFHDDVPDAFIDEIFAVMALAPQHMFMVLTKREKRMVGHLGERDRRFDGINEAAREISGDKWRAVLPTHRHGMVPGRWPLPNVQIGVTVEDQDYAYRIGELLKTPAAVRFVSYEPVLGPVDLPGLTDVELRGLRCVGDDDPAPLPPELLPAVDGVICGGESGPGARPMRPEWPRAVRDQCAAAGVPFFFKQWGAWREMGNDGADVEHPECRIDSSGRDVTSTPGLWSETDARMIRVGKKRAGRMLDGEIWDQLPEAKR